MKIFSKKDKSTNLEKCSIKNKNVNTPREEHGSVKSLNANMTAVKTNIPLKLP